MVDTTIGNIPQTVVTPAPDDKLEGEAADGLSSYQTTVGGLLGNTTVADAAQSDGYTIVGGDDVNGIKGSVLVFSGVTNTVNVNTGLGTYDAAAPLAFVIQNLGTGNLTVGGTATLAATAGFTAAILSNGVGVLQQTGTDAFLLTGNLVAA